MRVIDVSATGLGVMADDSLPNGGVLSVVVQLPVPHRPGNYLPVPLQAKLVHQVFSTGRNRAGLQILQIDPTHLRLMVNR
jgi:hypothetical protein